MLSSIIKPMLLTKSDSLSAKKDMLYELKIDGWRCLLKLTSDGNITLQTRHGTIATNKYPDIVEAALKYIAAEEIILDGEITCCDKDTGLPDFESVMKRFLVNNKKTIERLGLKHPAKYFVFDILYLDGNKTTAMSLVQRKELLNKVINDNSFIIPIDYYIGKDKGESLQQLTLTYGIEGICEKEPNSTYNLNTRSKNWRKLVNYKYTNCVITGFTKNKFGLYLANEENLLPLGTCEFMTPKYKKVLYEVAKSIMIDEDKEKVFLKPLIRCKIKHIGFTRKGYLRTPSFHEFIV